MRRAGCAAINASPPPMDLMDREETRAPRRAPALGMISPARLDRFRGALPLILLGLVVLLAYAPAWTRGQVYFELDTFKQNAPFAAFVSEELRAGEFPLWNPYLFTGYPQFADGQAGVLFPLHLPFFLAGAVEALLVWGPPLRSLLAALAAYAFARTLKISTAGSALAGITYGLGSFGVAQQHHFNIANAAPVLPLVLAAWERAFAAGSARPRLAWLGLAAFALSLVLLAVQPQLALITGFGLGTYVIASLAAGRWRVSTGRRATLQTATWALGGMVATVAIATGLAAVQVVPLLELIAESERADVLDLAEVSRFSVPPLGAAQLVFPGVFGRQDGYWFMWNAWETAFYAGVVPLALSLIALARPNRLIIVLALVGIAAALVAQGADGPTPAFDAVRRIPGFDRARAPGRFVMIAILMIGPLAGCGLDRLRHTAAPRLGAFLALLLVTAVASLGTIHLWARSGSEASQAVEQWLLSHRELSMIPGDPTRTALLMDSTNPLRPANLLPLAAGLLFLVIVVAAARAPSFRRWLAPVGVGLAAVELAFLAATFHAATPASDLLREVELERGITGPRSYPRLFVSEAVERGSNRFLLARAAEATGYAPLVPTRTKNLIDAWHDNPPRIAELLGVETAAYLDDGVTGFRSHLVEGATVTFSLNRPALVVDRWSPHWERTIELPEVTGIRAAHLVLSMDGGVDAAQGEPVGAATWLRDGTPLSDLPLLAGVHVSERTAFGALKVRDPSHGLGELAASFGESLGSVYTLARLDFEGPGTADTLELQVSRPGVAVTLHGISVIDQTGKPQRFWFPLLDRSGAREPLLLGHFESRPRARLVQRVRLVRDAEDALREVTRLGAERARRTVIEAGAWGPSLDPELVSEAAPDPRFVAHARLLEESSSELTIETQSSGPAMLVLRDAYYPGWKATVDGAPAPILPADLASRAVPVPPGAHRVELRFEPGSFRLGAALSAGSLVLLALLLLAVRHWPRIAGRLRRPRSTSAVSRTRDAGRDAAVE